MRLIVSESYQFDLGPNMTGNGKGKGEQTGIMTSLGVRFT